MHKYANVEAAGCFDIFEEKVEKFQNICFNLDDELVFSLIMMVHFSIETQDPSIICQPTIFVFITALKKFC
jgi:hypothetical protein